MKLLNEASQTMPEKPILSLTNSPLSSLLDKVSTTSVPSYSYISPSTLNNTAYSTSYTPPQSYSYPYGSNADISTYIHSYNNNGFHGNRNNTNSFGGNSGSYLVNGSTNTTGSNTNFHSNAGYHGNSYPVASGNVQQHYNAFYGTSGSHYAPY